MKFAILTNYLILFILFTTDLGKAEGYGSEVKSCQRVLGELSRVFHLTTPKPLSVARVPFEDGPYGIFDFRLITGQYDPYYEPILSPYDPVVLYRNRTQASYLVDGLHFPLVNPKGLGVPHWGPPFQWGPESFSAGYNGRVGLIAKGKLPFARSHAFVYDLVKKHFNPPIKLLMDSYGEQVGDNPILVHFVGESDTAVVVTDRLRVAAFELPGGWQKGKWDRPELAVQDTHNLKVASGGNLFVHSFLNLKNNGQKEFCLRVVDVVSKGSVVIKVGPYPIQQLSVSKDGSRIALLTGHRTKVYDLSINRWLEFHTNLEEELGTVISKDGRWLLTQGIPTQDKQGYALSMTDLASGDSTLHLLNNPFDYSRTVDMGCADENGFVALAHAQVSYLTGPLKSAIQLISADPDTGFRNLNQHLQLPILSSIQIGDRARSVLVRTKEPIKVRDEDGEIQTGTLFWLGVSIDHRGKKGPEGDSDGGSDNGNDGPDRSPIVPPRDFGSRPSPSPVPKPVSPLAS